MADPWFKTPPIAGVTVEVATMGSSAWRRATFLGNGFYRFEDGETIASWFCIWRPARAGTVNGGDYASSEVAAAEPV